MNNKILLVVLMLLFALQAPANGIRESVQETGLFWVAIVVLLLVLLGIFIYLFRLERKLKNLENKQ